MTPAVQFCCQLECCFQLPLEVFSFTQCADFFLLYLAAWHVYQSVFYDVLRVHRNCIWITHSGGGLVSKSCPTLATPNTVASQPPLSIGFPRQERWSGLPFPSPRDLPDSGIKPSSPALQAASLLLNHQGSPELHIHWSKWYLQWLLYSLDSFPVNKYDVLSLCSLLSFLKFLLMVFF